MPTRIDKLEPEQKARFDEWADRWIEIGLRTGPADRDLFERSARACYGYAGLEWPGRVVWVPSPLVLALAAPTAAHLLEGGGAVGGAVAGAVDRAVGEVVDEAVREAVGGAVGGAVDGAVTGAVTGAVDGAVREAVTGAVDEAVRGAVTGAVDEAVRGAVDRAVGGVVDGAVDGAVREAVGGAVGGAVDGAVTGAVDRAVDEAVAMGVDRAVDGAVDRAVDGAVREAVGGAVGGAVDGAVTGAVDRAVDGAVRGAVDRAVDEAVRGAVTGAVRGAVDRAVGGVVDGAVTGAVDRAVDEAVAMGVDGAVDGAVDRAVRNYWYRILGGQFWVGGWYWGGSWTSYLREVCGLELPGDLWDRARAYEGTMQAACWWWPHRQFVMVSERPLVIHRELVDPARPRGWGSHRLHCDDGPAVVWPDGWGVWAIHGVRVPQQVVERPDTLTPAQILGEENAEVRRVMTERFGPERLIRETAATVVDDDPEHGTLYRLDLDDDEPLVMVKVVNSTPEPDGSFRDYWLRVPPDMGSAAHAVAWTFEETPESYRVGAAS